MYPHIIYDCEWLCELVILTSMGIAECRKLFQKKTNVNFVKIENRNKVVIKTFERGLMRALI